MTKTISKIPFRKAVLEESEKIAASIRRANYPGFFSAFVYANIGLYFLAVANWIFS